ncbi:MAG: YihY/virulence factor BrkB family protein [Deltaproteobacteria bacterium]|nr:YihY/virulence factor BrkB family protein [Deltaproteobacteria bacterium]
MLKFIVSIWRGFRLFLKIDGMNRAAAISFFALFSLVPLILLIAAILGSFLGKNAQVMENVVTFVKQGLPYLSDRIINDLNGLSLKWKTYGWVGFVTLLWSADLVFDSMSSALAATFDTTSRFGFVRRKIVNMLVLCLSVAAAFFSLMTTTLAGILRHYKFKVFEIDLYHYLIESLTFKYVLPMGFLFVAAALVYRMFSGPNLNLRHAFYGGLLFTVLWEAAKQLFALYISYFPAFNKFYASIGTVMLLMAWIYYTISIFLFCAAFARVSHERTKTG